MAREGAEERRRRAGRIARRLARTYPEARTALRWETPFQLLVATILSAQCTDQKVNEVTQTLFTRWGTPGALADADAERVEAVVRPTGFYRQKTKSIQAAARDVVERFGGEVPDTLEELVSLRGVARKTANVVLGSAFGVPGIAVDTHVKRVTGRLELTAHDDPEKIERDLMELLPRKEWTAFSLRTILHGRETCTARAPRCDDCVLREECPYPERAVRGGAARRGGSRRR
ncbi:MAG: endonuclease III [Myxococcota bacterium]|nr:endonuclease III [Myxococcota bacterium]